MLTKPLYPAVLLIVSCLIFAGYVTHQVSTDSVTSSSDAASSDAASLDAASSDAASLDAASSVKPDELRAPRIAAPLWRFDLDASAPQGTAGMVVTADSYASKVGLNVLKAGGNAVDAAVATAFALAVTYPTAGNIGGGGFMVLRLADGTRAALDFRETAPAAATHDMYLDAAGDMTDRSLLGPLAAGVPGSPMGLWQAHQRFGSLDWSALVKPAIQLAEGFQVQASLHDGLSLASKKLEHLSASELDPFAATLTKFYPGGEPPVVGSMFRQPNLAAALRRIADLGPDGFYRGRTAELIVATMKRHGGIITLADLAAYQAEWREPIVFEYRGYTIVSMPPVSSGGVTMGEIAKILEGYELSKLDYDSAEHIHLLAEAMKRAFSDRNHYLGDPAFVTMPLEEMISDDYAARRRADIRGSAATPASEVGPALGPADFGNDTTHFSIVDGQGNAVSVTTTINMSFGSLVTVDGAGFLLNNEMDDFAAKPGYPNGFGLVQGEANAIEPGKRMLSSMTPTIVLDPDGQLLLVTGSPGGSTIITATFQTISNVIDFGLAAAAVVAAPRMHHQHLPDRILIEAGGFSPDTLDGLERLGHVIQPLERLGDVQAIYVRSDGTFIGISDPRGYGTAEGY